MSLKTVLFKKNHFLIKKVDIQRTWHPLESI